jgi:1-deoxy-D-xylulose-5-phosphate reductoisomerase
VSKGISTSPRPDLTPHALSLTPAKRRIALLGAPGSIGRQTLEVAAAHPDRLEIVAMTARSDGRLLAEAAARAGSVRYLGLSDPDADVAPLEDARRGTLYGCPGSTGTHKGCPYEIGRGPEALIAAATHPEVDVVVVAVVGTAGLSPTIAALDAGNAVALATKEALVVGGHLVIDASRGSGAPVLPIDSEHSAILQCLRGAAPEEIEAIMLTASGGPFVDSPPEQMERMTAADALRHPTWRMGPKVTIDSATLMNKGLEVIEARWLFDVPAERIQVLVHRQSIVHSLVQFRDGSMIAQLGCPDMRLPIQYALLYPERPASPWPRLDLTKAGSLTFEEPCPERFPCLELAYRAAATGGTLPAVMSAANEEVVGLFLAGKIGFSEIPQRIRRVMDAHENEPSPTLDTVLRADAWARRAAREA